MGFPNNWLHLLLTGMGTWLVMARDSWKSHQRVSLVPVMLILIVFSCLIVEDLKGVSEHFFPL